MKYAATSCNCENSVSKFSDYICGQIRGQLLEIFGGKILCNSFHTESEIFKFNVQVLPLISPAAQRFGPLSLRFYASRCTWEFQ